MKDTSMVAPPTGVQCSVPARRSMVRAGDTIISSEPFACVLKSSLVATHCAFCLQKNCEVRRCSACKVLRFCSSQCHKRAWRQFHRHECVAISKVAHKIIPDSALLLARIITRLQNGGDNECEWLGDTRRRYFKHLMSHYSDIKADDRRMQHVQSLAALLPCLLSCSHPLPNSAELIGIYGRMCVNSFNVLDEDMSPVGVAVYVAPSVIDHSCQPNAVATFSGRTLHVRALVDIDVFCWSKVRISYIDTLADRQGRQHELMTGYYFVCDCDSCKNEQCIGRERTVLCSEEGCGGEVVVPRVEDSHLNVSCLTCGCHVVDVLALARRVDDVIQASRDCIDQCSSSVYYELCCACMQRQMECRLHPLNVYVVKLNDMCFEATLAVEMWERSLELGQMLLPGYRMYYGRQHPLYGLLLLKLAKLSCYLMRDRERALDWLSTACQVIASSHGASHSVLTRHAAPLRLQLTAGTAGHEHLC